MINKEELIILKRFSINENDLLLTLLGQTSGKIQLKAKGSKKFLSRFTGRLEPLTIINGEIYKNSLVNAEIKKSTLNYQSTYENLHIIQLICLSINTLTPYGEQNHKLYHLLKQTILNNNLNHTYYLYFKTQLLKLNGISQSLKTCHICAHILGGNKKIYLNNNHIVCQNCIKTSPQNYYKTTSTHKEVTLQSLKLINFFQNYNYQTINIPHKIKKEVEDILNTLIHFLHA